ncbi:dehydrogenase/reductase SDR family member 12-like [Paramacrobiotus metropolitanus]|uniref:dehydrogenase/reductase SDR family member 12-like n=1 Tax=Paramacrobiotus metropolitanus TaxID=2943436 RepID=UPI0024459B2F|nr:dehydrogenase/reductase SDR family member 12-like [Paramacrobiotus metropolitanus]
MSWFRGSVFSVKGMWQFTKGGFERARANFHDEEMTVACDNRVFIITGANSGIGRAIAEELVRRGGNVHIVCRNPDKCAETGRHLRQLNGSAQVTEHVVNMSEMSAILEFTERFKKVIGKLDVLINNAGVLLDEQINSKEKFDVSFATNSLGPYVLTRELLPLLEQSADARVITMSSGGMYNEKLDLEDIQSINKGFNGTRAYAQQKRQEVIMMEQFALKHPKVLFTSMHPGWVDTPGVERSLPTFYQMMKNKLRKPAEGADTAIWLSTVPRSHSGIVNGGFYFDRQSVSKHLPLAWTHSAPEEDAQLMTMLADFTMQALRTKGITEAT